MLNLNRASNRAARLILANQSAKQEPVALLFENGVQVITVIFAVLKAGKLFVPPTLLIPGPGSPASRGFPSGPHRDQQQAAYPD
jgi:hypothetical protein